MNYHEKGEIWLGEITESFRFSELFAEYSSIKLCYLTHQLTSIVKFEEKTSSHPDPIHILKNQATRKHCRPTHIKMSAFWRQSGICLCEWANQWAALDAVMTLTACSASCVNVARRMSCVWVSKSCRTSSKLFLRDHLNALIAFSTRFKNGE